MTKIFVGLSGGVDSAVAAKLLMDQGYEVAGIFIKIWQPEFTACTWEEDRLSAKRVAAALSIPFLEVDLSDEYKKDVVEDMVRSYARGITPNPDVLCNQYIKFGAFKGWAKKKGADFVATGHYARVVKNNSRFELYRGKDPSKDQVYFLYRLSEKDLSESLFPIGDYTKDEVRAIARKAGIPSANRPDSQGLCFVGEVSIGDFLGHYIPVVEGDVRNVSGDIIGKHEGSAQYTIGQRHGFTLREQDGSPHYVTAIDTQRNTITVSTDPHDAHTKSAVLQDVTWINEKPKEDTLYQAEVRYHQKPHPVYIRYMNNRQAKIEFEEPQIVSPGQSVVLYDGTQCIGGGVVNA